MAGQSRAVRHRSGGGGAAKQLARWGKAVREMNEPTHLMGWLEQIASKA
jgi:hypothetical protein